MNNQSLKLLSILAACDTNDAELAYENKIQKILHSVDYRELQHRSVFSAEFEKSFSENQLRKYDIKKLDSIMNVLPVVAECLEDILYSLKNGDAPSLTAVDRPEFTDIDSLEQLSDKLQKASGKNYSNISDSEFMMIFDETTVKSIKDIFNSLPYDCNDYKSAIDALLINKKYCISENEIKEYEVGFDSQVNRINEEIDAAKKEKRLHRLKKPLIGIFCVFLPMILSVLTGAMSNDAEAFSTVLIFILVVIYWIKG